MRFRGDGVADWIEQFAAATARSANLALAYLADVRELQDSWRTTLRESGRVSRADAVAWRIIDLMPAHPIISAAVVVAAIDRARSRVYEGITQLVEAGVLVPLTDGKRNRWWEAAGLLELIARMEEG
jgi:Fic family protein